VPSLGLKLFLVFWAQLTGRRRLHNHTHPTLATIYLIMVSLGDNNDIDGQFIEKEWIGARKIYSSKDLPAFVLCEEIQRLQILGWWQMRAKRAAAVSS